MISEYMIFVRIYKSLKKNNKKEQLSTKRNIQIANKHMKMFLTIYTDKI